MYDVDGQPDYGLDPNVTFALVQAIRAASDAGPRLLPDPMPAPQQDSGFQLRSAGVAPDANPHCYAHPGTSRTRSANASRRHRRTLPPMPPAADASRQRCSRPRRPTSCFSPSTFRRRRGRSRSSPTPRSTKHQAPSSRPHAREPRGVYLSSHAMTQHCDRRASSTANAVQTTAEQSRRRDAKIYQDAPGRRADRQAKIAAAKQAADQAATDKLHAEYMNKARIAADYKVDDNRKLSYLVSTGARDRASSRWALSQHATR